jgi:putative endonuclease
LSAGTDARHRRGHAARRRGFWAETFCVWSLRLRGYAILGRGVVTGRGTGAGEIDIIARRGRLLAFVEVKARPTRDLAAYAISPQQCQRLSRAASAFLAHRGELADCAIRFDAMLVAPWKLPLHLIDAWRDAR